MIHIPDADKKLIIETITKYLPDCKAWVFGSRINGNFKSYSDLDIVLFSPEIIKAGILQDIKEELSETDITYRIDIVDWKRLSDNFREIIKASHEILI